MESVYISFIWFLFVQTYQSFFSHSQDGGVGLQVNPGAAPHSLQTLHRDVGGVSEPQTD